MQTKYQMMEIALEPDLSTCIQTLARRQHERIVRELLKSGKEDPELEQKAEMLRMFLETTDFKKLRSKYEPYLMKGKKVKFALRLVTGKTEYSVKIR